MSMAVETGPAFVPAWWAGGPHAQTLTARMLRSPEGPSFTRERLTTPDGDFLDVDWGPEPSPESPIVVVLHGLEGSSQRRYVRSVCSELIARGVRPVAMNFRGCSGEPNRALHFYHSGDTLDITWLVELVRSRHPGRTVGGMGFSLGGNVLLKSLGEREDGGTGHLDAAAVMSVPYDLAAGCALLQRSRMGRVYSEYFMRSLRKKVEAKRDRLGTMLDLAAVDAVRSIWDFDDAVTAPLNGFTDAADYYARCSSNGFLAEIAVPTLMLHAEDDPFLPADAIPRAEVEGNPALRLELAPQGGHVGFLSGTPWAPRFWGEVTAAAFLAERLNAKT